MLTINTICFVVLAIDALASFVHMLYLLTYSKFVVLRIEDKDYCNGIPGYYARDMKTLTMYMCKYKADNLQLQLGDFTRVHANKNNIFIFNRNKILYLRFMTIVICCFGMWLCYLNSI